MVKQLSNSITSFLIQENIIENDTAEIYCYGIEQIIINMSTLIVVSLVASTFHIWSATIFFFVGFMPIRLIAGGYHAKTSQRCNMLSLMVYAVNMFLINSINNYMTSTIDLGIGIIIISSIFEFAPVDHKNRVLEDDEYTHVKIRSRLISVGMTIFCVSLALLIEPNNMITTGTMMGGLTASISIIIGSIIRGGEKDEEVKFSN